MLRSLRESDEVRLHHRLSEFPREKRSDSAPEKGLRCELITALFQQRVSKESHQMNNL